MNWKTCWLLDINDSQYMLTWLHDYVGVIVLLLKHIITKPVIMLADEND